MEEQEDLRFEWETVSGEKFSGVIIDTDDEVLIVRLDNGDIKAV